MLSARVLRHHLDFCSLCQPTQAYTSTVLPSLHPSILWESSVCQGQNHGQLQTEQHCNCVDWKKVLNWPVWLNEEGQYRPPFPHMISPVFLSNSPSLPHCCLYFRAKAIPGPARLENSAACQTYHSDTLSSLSSVSANPPTSSSHRLSWKVAVFCRARSCILTLLHASQSYQTEVTEVFKTDFFPLLNKAVSHILDCPGQGSKVLSCVVSNSNQGGLTAGDACSRIQRILIYSAILYRPHINTGPISEQSHAFLCTNMLAYWSLMNMVLFQVTNSQVHKYWQVWLFMKRYMYPDVLPSSMLA